MKACPFATWPMLGNLFSKQCNMILLNVAVIYSGKVLWQMCKS